MRDILRENKIFFYPYLLFLIIVLPVLLRIPKSEIHLYLNGFHCVCADYFFRYITWLGDGFIPFVLGIAFSFSSYRKGLITFASGIFSGIVAQFFKRIVFPEIIRPSAYFDGIADLHFVDGVSLHHSFSFPSGHAASAFAMYLSVALLSKNQFVKASMFFLATLVAFSRVYLSQHFLNDIYAGSVIGVFCSIVAVVLFYRMNNKWLDKSLMQLISRR